MLIKKYKTMIIILLLTILFSIQTINANTLPLLGVIITVDPGHGGRDPGTSYYNLKEKDINLEISKELEKELSKKGAIVYMVRNSDIDLSSIYDYRKKRGDLYRRIKYIEKNKSDLYLSIHINWYKNSYYKGAEVLYNSINSNNKLLAESIMAKFKTELNSNRNISKTDLYMYKNITTPGVLIECGYLSNYNERKLLILDDYQEKISKSITAGIINYYENTKET